MSITFASVRCLGTFFPSHYLTQSLYSRAKLIEARGLTWRPTPAPEEQAFKAMKASLAAGCNFWNAGEFYGTESYNSLHLHNKYFTKYPEDADKVVLSVKGVLVNMHPDGRCVVKSFLKSSLHTVESEVLQFCVEENKSRLTTLSIVQRT